MESPGQTQSVVFEELLVAIDAAGQLQGDDMDQGANPQTFAPDWANGVEKVAVLALGNGDQLGASNVIGIVSGPAFPDGPHELPMGGDGGENIDLRNEGSPPTVFTDMGMRVLPGLKYRVDFQSAGDAQDEFGCSMEITFQDIEVETPKHWESTAVTTAVVDVEVQGTDLNQDAGTIPPGNSIEIGGVITCGAGDMAALGVNHIINKIKNGVVDEQQFICGGVGGELVIGSGAHISPSQRTHLAIKLKGKTAIYSEFMSIIEAGIMDGVAAFGFVVP